MIFNPAHPGEVLRDYLGEMTVAEAATRLGVTRAHLSRILNTRAGVSAAMSLRLSAALGTSPEFWLKMQMQHDLWRAQKAKQPKISPFPHMAKNDEHDDCFRREVELAVREADDPQAEWVSQEEVKRQSATKRAAWRAKSGSKGTASA